MPIGRFPKPFRDAPLEEERARSRQIGDKRLINMRDSTPFHRGRQLATKGVGENERLDRPSRFSPQWRRSLPALASAGFRRERCSDRTAMLGSNNDRPRCATMTAQATRLLAALAAFVASTGAAAAAQAVPVDLELVIAVDVSGSMDAEEQAVQRAGYVEAIRHPISSRPSPPGPISASRSPMSNGPAADGRRR